LGRQDIHPVRDGADALHPVLEHPEHRVIGVLLGENPRRTVDITSRVCAGGFRQYDGQPGLRIQQITGQRATQGARDAVAVPVIGIAHPAHALESVGVIPNVGVCPVGKQIAIQVVGQGRATLCDQLIS